MTLIIANNSYSYAQSLNHYPPIVVLEQEEEGEGEAGRPVREARDGAEETRGPCSQNTRIL